MMNLYRHARRVMVLWATNPRKPVEHRGRDSLMVLERDQPSRLRARLNAPRLAVWGCVLGLLSAGLAGAQVGPVVSKDKKLIGWACDRINAREFRMRVVELERHLPFDGLVITVSPDAFELEDGRYARWFGGKRHHRKDFQQVIEDLKATKDTRFTDNFIDFETTVRFDPAPEEANLDWFDPKWSVIAENAAVAAHVAKEGRFKGLFIDVEAYAGGLGPWRTPFNHVSYATLTRADGKTPRTLEACVEQVRKRGRQFMRAVTEVYPDITIVMIQDTGWGSGPLVTAFVEGILEVRGEATLVDGAEQGLSNDDLSGDKGASGCRPAPAARGTLRRHGARVRNLVGLANVGRHADVQGQRRPEEREESRKIGTRSLQRLDCGGSLCLGLLIRRLHRQCVVAQFVPQRKGLVDSDSGSLC